ncbi:class I SAM-dependent methyltransferase [Natrialbaceae archaeon A-gly3]
MGKGSPEREELPMAFRRHLSETELQKTSILHSIDEVKSQLAVLERVDSSIESILDIGCNRGGLVAALAEHLGASEIHGIDTDGELRRQAAEKGVTVHDVNVEDEPFPLEDDSIDLVVSFGLLEHLRYYDTLFEEVRRVLDDGWFWVATPNLGSWINRFSLITGHQPRNVELSRKHAAGVLPVYDEDDFLNHVHAPTYKALLELLEYYDFDPIDSVPISPYQQSTLVRLIDWICSHRMSWSRRVAVLARQQSQTTS